MTFRCFPSLLSGWDFSGMMLNLKKCDMVCQNICLSLTLKYYCIRFFEIVFVVLLVEIILCIKQYCSNQWLPRIVFCNITWYSFQFWMCFLPLLCTRHLMQVCIISSHLSWFSIGFSWSKKSHYNLDLLQFLDIWFKYDVHKSPTHPYLDSNWARTNDLQITDTL